MIPFENTDLQIIELESAEDHVFRLYLLNEVVEDAPFIVDDFVAEMDTILPKIEGSPELFDKLLERMNIIDILDQDDIEDLIEDGIIDPEDLHQTIYDFFASEDDDDFFDEDELDSI